MTSSQWRIVLGINLITVLVVLSPFLPGPSFLSKPTNTIFNLAQFVGILGFLLIPVGLIKSIKQTRKPENKKRNITPILLMTVPTFVLVITIWGADVARNFSRNYAIKNSVGLIEALENYKEKNNQYPNKLSSLTPDFLQIIPQPGIMGISAYGYEKVEGSYNLRFSQNVIMSFNFEVVVYDPVGRHKAQGELETLYNTGKDNWKYYIYD